MSDKLVQMSDHKKAKVHYKGLSKQFNRPSLRREFEPVHANEKRLHPDLGDDMLWYTSRYVGPGDSFRELGAFDLIELGIGPELLIYRVLRDLYGLPDITTAAFPKSTFDDKEKPEPVSGMLPWEWSYMLKGSSEAHIEVRKQPGTQRPYFAIWVPRLSVVSAETKQEVQADIDRFLQELRKTLKASQHLLDRKEIKKKAPSLGPINVYADLIAAGDEQLAITSKLTADYKRKVLDKKQAGRTTPGTFHLGAAIDYLLALEAFVNLLSELLRKEEFQAEVFDRATTRADFELRVLSLSLYCIGFERVPTPPESLAFGHIRRLRAFRNNLLHGNLSRDDHVIYLVPQDYFIFHWWPAAEAGDAHSSFEELPVARTLFRKSHAQSVRKLVEEVVDAIIASLEPKYRKWVAGWRKNLLVPATLDNGRWTPNLKPPKKYSHPIVSKRT